MGGIGPAALFLLDKGGGVDYKDSNMPTGKSSPPKPHKIKKAILILLIAAAPSLRGEPAGRPFSATGSELKKEYDRWVHRSWTTENGLPQNTVYALAQAGDGRLWIGSDGGLACFDGGQFTVFRKNSTLGLMSDSVTALCPGDKGALWVGTHGGGVARLSGGKFAPVRGLEGERIAWLQGIDGRSAWAVTHDGVLFHLQNERTAELVIIEGLSSERINTVAGDHASGMWIGTASGLFLLRGGKRTLFNARSGLAGDYVYCLFKDSRGRLWIGTTTGLSRIDETGIRSFTTADGLASGMVLAIGEDAQGRMWIGTDRGITVMDVGERVSCATPSGLAGDTVLAIRRDREDGMWVGWAGGGLSLMRRNEVRVFSQVDGLSGRQLRSVCEDGRGRIWAGTRDGGLNCLENGKWRIVSRRDGLASNAVTALIPDRNDRLWIGTLDAGLQIMEGGRFFTAPPPGGPAKGAILSFHIDSGGGDLWVGGDGIGLYQLSGGQWRHHGEANGLRTAVITALNSDHHGTVWAGSSGDGLFSYSWRSRSWLPAPAGGMAGESVYSIADQADGLWLGTSAGLVLLRGGALFHFKKGPEPLKGAILQILEDRHGWLWMSTPSGILRAEKAALEAAAPAGGLGVHCRVFGEMSGMLSTACTGGFQPAGWLDEAGRLWFPTQNGLVLIDPRRLPPGPPPPVPRLVSALADGITIQGGQALPAGTQRIDLTFAATSFADPRQIGYSTRLDGFEKDWSAPHIAGSRSFSGLGAGTYVFQVKARGLSGTWSERADPFTFSIRPYFHRTAWFYLLLLAGSGLFAAGLLFYRRQQARKRKEDKYKSSALGADKILEYMHRLDQVMEKDKAYLDTELNLGKLAEAAAIPAKHLSQLINEHYGLNFNDFVNRFRVEEAKRRLLDPAAREFKLLRIAFESGFNSKSVFNGAFRHHTGLSPSEFRRLLGGGEGGGRS